MASLERSASTEMAALNTTLREELAAFAVGAMRQELGRFSAELKQDIHQQLQQKPPSRASVRRPSGLQVLPVEGKTQMLAMEPVPVKLKARFIPAPLSLEEEEADIPESQPTLRELVAKSPSGKLVHEWTTRRLCGFRGRRLSVDDGSGKLMLPTPKLPETLMVKQVSQNPNQDDLDVSISDIDATMTQRDLGQQMSKSTEFPGQVHKESSVHGPMEKQGSTSSTQLGKLPSVEAWTPMERTSIRSTGALHPEVAPAVAMPWAHARAGEVTKHVSADGGTVHCQHFAHIVNSPLFDYVIGFFVFLNSVAIGIQVDITARNLEKTVPAYLRLCEICFCAVFAVELTLRLLVHRGNYFYNHGWKKWNCVDISLVALQIFEETLRAALSARESLSTNFTFMRCLRILQFIRVLRGVRILSLVAELRTLVASILHAARSLAWAVVLLALVIYVCSIWLTQIVADFEIHNQGNRESKALQFYFGSLGSTALSLYQSVTGGLDWDDAVHPLIDAISPVFAPIFAMYIAFVVMCMLNIVTGVFVHSAMKYEKEDTDLFMKNNIFELFGGGPGQGSSGALKLADFERHLDSKIMQEYFKAIDVDPSEAKGVFDLLDLDGSGTIDAEEFLSGCLRLRGPARALELELVMHEVRNVHKELLMLAHSFQAYVDDTSGQPTLEDDDGNLLRPLRPARTISANDAEASEVLSKALSPMAGTQKG